VFLLTIGLGYMTALANLYYTHQGRDGTAGLTVEDIVIAYQGATSQTRLGTAINGIMEANLRYKTDKDVIMKWLHQGADEAGYNDKIAPILNRDCIGCHTPSINPSLPDLTHFATVSEVAHAGGASIPTLIRVSHIHLFGIAFILFFIGKIFLLCDLNVHVKRIAVVIPFVAMLLDVLSWFMTKEISCFVYLIIFSGALMGLSIGLQILLSIYQMWFYSTQKSPQTVIYTPIVAENIEMGPDKVSANGAAFDKTQFVQSLTPNGPEHEVSVISISGNVDPFKRSQDTRREHMPFRRANDRERRQKIG